MLLFATWYQGTIVYYDKKVLTHVWLEYWGANIRLLFWFESGGWCVCVWGGGVCALIYLWTDKRMYPCSSNGIMHEALWRQKGLDSAWISDLTDKFRSSNYAVCQPNPAQPQKCHMILYIQSEDVNKKKGWMRRGDVTFHFCNGITSQKLWRIYSGRVEVHFTQYSSK